jgi:hypothetical protein
MLCLTLGPCVKENFCGTFTSALFCGIYRPEGHKVDFPLHFTDSITLVKSTDIQRHDCYKHSANKNLNINKQRNWLPFSFSGTKCVSFISNTYRNKSTEKSYELIIMVFVTDKKKLSVHLFT